MRSSKCSPQRPTAPAASTDTYSTVSKPRLALLREGGTPPASTRAAAARERPQGTRLQPPASVAHSARGYRDQLQLAVAIPTLPERERDDAKDSLTSVLVMLALCVFLGLVASAGLATSRGLRLGREPESRQPEIREPAAVLRQETPAVPAYGLPRNERLAGVSNSMTSGDAGAREFRRRASQVDGDDKHRRNASVRLLGSWEDTPEPREWTMDLTPSDANEAARQFPLMTGDNASLSTDRLSAPTAKKRGATAPLQDTTPKFTTPGSYREITLTQIWDKGE